MDGLWFRFRWGGTNDTHCSVWDKAPFKLCLNNCKPFCYVEIIIHTGTNLHLCVANLCQQEIPQRNSWVIQLAPIMQVSMARIFHIWLNLIKEHFFLKFKGTYLICYKLIFNLNNHYFFKIRNIRCFNDCTVWFYTKRKSSQINCYSHRYIYLGNVNSILLPFGLNTFTEW